MPQNSGDIKTKKCHFKGINGNSYIIQGVSVIWSFNSLQRAVHSGRGLLPHFEVGSLHTVTCSSSSNSSAHRCCSSPFSLLPAMFQPDLLSKSTENDSFWWTVMVPSKPNIDCIKQDIALRSDKWSKCEGSLNLHIFSAAVADY